MEMYRSESLQAGRQRQLVGLFRKHLKQNGKKTLRRRQENNGTSLVRFDPEVNTNGMLWRRVRTPVLKACWYSRALTWHPHRSASAALLRKNRKENSRRAPYHSKRSSPTCVFHLTLSLPPSYQARMRFIYIAFPCLRIRVSGVD